MNDDKGKALLLGCYIFAVALVTWNEIHDNHRVPLPSRYLSAGLVFGTLGLVGPFITYPLAAVIGLGVVVALYYQHWQIKPDNGNGGSQNPNGGNEAKEPPQLAPR